MLSRPHRRDLLIGGTAAALALPGASALAGSFQDRKLGYAIVGLGRYADVILPRFAECRHSRVTALVSGSMDKARRYAAQYGVPETGLYGYDTFDTIRDNPDVDIVYVILPNGMHHEYTLRSAAAGKHVMCEKPMANTAAEAESMIAACRAAGRKLMIGYRSHFEAANREAMRIVRDGELGRVRIVTAEHGFNAGDPTQWRLNKALAGGGSLMDIGIYSLQAARYLTGEEPASVTAVESTDRSDVRFREVEDTINFQLTFPSGVVAHCVSTYGSNHNRYRVVGTEGWLDAEPATAYNGNRLRLRRGGETVDHVAPAQPNNQFSAQLDHLSQCVMTDSQPIVAGEEGLRDMRIIEAIYQAAREGRTVAL
ncbi:glucose-fructose oxidoreductase [Brevundimonas sp. LM2]|uniref:Gfo/Idh/MocA family protein n=1 Tax=Brevundimonas sp. LM2 TaxID=1938605 RepID=UPI000983E6C1|nr:Gfo/Idh/MocA family oxidoreductase [Brevundimonas sp. LM2]AQR62779.1 glucose-fructose oxidoreductase [Brevundimonas sp. LM2]